MQRRTFLTSSLAATSLLARANPGSPTPAPGAFTVKAGDARFGVHTPYRGVNTNDLKISARDTGGAVSVFEYVGREKVGPPLHLHRDQDEIFYIVEGEYRFQVGNETFTATAGDTVFGPRNVPHTWIQLSDSGKMTYLVQPSGKLEDFFLKMNALKGPPSEALVQQLHTEHGMTVLGPPLH
ncbi:cupin domain-containing protein [Fibrella sp. HMF5335]|uniref:Cupin domain-containing protein n=1 Tax=Fibrella rubiginis TaxID=2817060 RepID=A0A939GIY2_9BACT|nr:cupin domain-containing protein [Fibrella rubiginis]MBO0937278.1 cupin domain-containing protein [Fibrella rubiginis]